MIVGFFMLIMICVSAYFLSPLLGPAERWLTDVDYGAARRALEAEKESYLRAMKDIEFEHASNKINDSDYADLKLHYGAQAAKAIRAIELLRDDEHPALEEPQDLSSGQVELQKKLEVEIANIKEKLDKLESGWDNGAVDDAQYVELHDELMAQLENLVARLEKARA